VESVPLREEIKRGDQSRDRWIANYAQTLRNLAACGIHAVCYNFSAVLDWTRTDTRFELPDGSWALRFDHRAFAAFDLFVLQRPGARAEYEDEDFADAERYYRSAAADELGDLTETIIAGLPGSEETYSLDSLRSAVASYRGVDAAALRDNLGYFLRKVVPVAEESGVRLAIHPDDPPRSLLGLPRIVSTQTDMQWILDEVPSPANGVTLCTGSLGVRPDNDVPSMVRAFAPRIYFAHLRSTRRETDPRDFHESGHLDGDIDMVAIIAELVAEERRRERDGGPLIPLRPDHGQRIVDDKNRVTNPGYPLIGRLKGLAELRGVEGAVRALSGEAACG